MPTPSRRLRRLSMTAAIPPACCAGADDGKIRALNVGRLCGVCRGFAAADSGADHPGIGAKSRHRIPTNSPPPHRLRQLADPDTDFIVQPNSTATPTGSGSARIGQGPGQAALQPDDHQPGARHGAARRQRTGQLRRLRQRVRLGGIVLGRRSWPQESDAQSGIAGGHRLRPVQRRRLQRHQRADRRIGAAL